MSASEWALTGIVIAGAAILGLTGPRISTAILRARWAWLCRKPPARTEGKLNRADYLTFVGLVESWRLPAYGEEPERSRT